MSKKNKLFLTLAIFFFVATLIFAGGPKRWVLLDKANPPKPYAEGEVIVKFKKGLDLAAVNSFAQTKSLKMKKHFKVLSKAKGQQYALLSSPGKADPLTLVNALRNNPQVEFVSPNYRREVCATPNDPKYSRMWAMNNTGQTGGTSDADIDAPEAWDHSTGSSSVIVADIDTGFDYLHSDLAANAWTNPGEIAGNDRDDDGNGYIDDVYGIDPAGVNGTVPDCDPMDGNGHGTHTAGTIGAVGNNALGVVGVNWNVKVMGLKFFDDAGGNAYDSFAIECIEYAVWEKQYHGQNVVAINASWGGYDSSATEPVDALRDAIEFANDAGIVFCAAVGNGDGYGGSGSPGDDNDSVIHHYPSDYTLPGIIAVTATDHNDALGSFANYGATSVDLGAPGVSILSTVPRALIPHAGDIFFDDMENGQSYWITSGTKNSWAITDEYEIYWGGAYPEAPSYPHFWSDSPGSGGGTVYTLYQSNTNSYLTYEHDINLSAYASQNVYLGLTMGRHIGTGDHVYVDISADSGANWTQIQDWGSTGGSVYFWASFSWAIPDAYKTANFRMRFHLVSNNAGNGLGVVIDDIGIVTNLGSPYESWDGTSMATPHVAGAVGLMASVFPNETVSQRKKRILDYGDDITSLHGITVSGRRLNLHNSIIASPPSTDPAIKVTSPDGGESWVVGTSHNITWTSEGTVNNVNIDYSTNSGTSWTPVVSDTPNDGTHPWTVPNAPSATCLVRVQEITDGIPTDRSDAVFSIVSSGTETVSTPDKPNGPATGAVGANYTYVTGGSESNWSDPVQYYFDWGDGFNSGWLPVGTTMATHAWTLASTYNVRARARCETHTTIVSFWTSNFAVTLNNEPTWVGISRFDACAEESQPTIEWHTASEIGPVGFNLWRQDKETKEYQLVNPNFLPSLPNSPQGGVYQVADPGASFGEPVVYRLEEIDSQGRSRSYGPFTVTFGAASWNGTAEPEVKAGREVANDIYGYRRFPRERSFYEQERLNARHQEQHKGSLPAVAQGNERVRVTVKGKGLFYVSATQVANSLGMSETGAAALISNYNLRLAGMGKEIAWLADASGAGLFFYNEGVETVYSDRNIYFLERGSGLAMETVSGGNAGTTSGNQSYKDTLHFEGNLYALLLPSMDPAGDLWFWDYVIAGSAAKLFPIQVPGVSATGKATLNVTLQGATDTAANNDHHAIIFLNGKQVGDATWDGTNEHTFEITFDSSLLQEGANTISVSGTLDGGAPYSIFYVESFDLSYQRYYKAVGNSLICRGDGNPVVTVSGLTELQAVVLDVTNSDRPKQLTGVIPDVSGCVTFVPSSASNTYLVSGLNASLRPDSVFGDRPAQLNDSSLAAEYVVIAPEELAGTAQELADYRQSKGLKSLVVTLEDIYDAFNYGVPSPLAIRDFIAEAYSKGSGKKLKYAVLAGKGTYDYNDYQGHGDNLVPAIMGRTPEGLCAADRIYGDVSGENGLPEIAIGRLPAVTNVELKAMIDKVKAYESGLGDWTGKAIFIADNADNGGDFAQGSNELAGLATGFQVEKIYLAGSAQETRSKIIASWNAGAALVNYCGHASISQLATENIFNVSDAASLQNSGQLPLAIMLTCVAGHFELPGFTSLGEALMLNQNGGMAGGLMPSGAALHADSLRLVEEFYKAVFQGQEESAGAALLAAMKSYLQLGGNAVLLNVYNWLGDPAVAFK